MQEIIDNWNKFLDTLERDLPAASFDLWVKPLKPVDFKDGCIVIAAESAAAKNFIGKNYLSLFVNALKNCFKGYISFKLLDAVETEEFFKNKKGNSFEAPKEVLAVPQISEDVSAVNKEENKSKFNSKYSFNNFVVGRSNQFSYAAAMAVSENPGIKFNPLFIYGGSGLGKTHLLHSIGHALLINKPGINVVYTTCENFMNDYIESLGSKSVNKFRSQYRNVDVLMVDDIQFLVNKPSTQEEFFHTFNDLYQNSKQIVLACDRNPKELTTLEERLRSRFQSGLIQDIQSPEYETRLAILEKKVEVEHFKITKEALAYIAEKIETNIRELEGFLQKVHFHATLHGKSEADITDAYDAFDDKLKEEKKDLTMEKICEAVCSYFGLSGENLKGKKRSKEYIDPRHIAIYLICELIPDLPLASIGSVFGGRDHSSIIHGRDKIEQQIKINEKTKKQVSDIKGLIFN